MAFPLSLSRFSTLVFAWLWLLCRVNGDLALANEGEESSHEYISRPHPSTADYAESAAKIAMTPLGVVTVATSHKSHMTSHDPSQGHSATFGTHLGDHMTSHADIDRTVTFSEQIEDHMLSHDVVSAIVSRTLTFTEHWPIEAVVSSSTHSEKTTPTITMDSHDLPISIPITSTQSSFLTLSVSSLIPESTMTVLASIPPSPPSPIPTPSVSPTAVSGQGFNYMLLVYVLPPVGVVTLCVVGVAIILCCRKYRRIYRYRQHLVPLTDMDGSDDSQGSSEEEDNEPSFMVHSTSMTRPVLVFDED